MSDLRKAAQDVVTVWKMHGTAESLHGWMEILEAALAQPPEPVQEPVAFVNADHLQGLTLGLYGYAEIYTDESAGRVPLYTAPPQRPPLTDEEIAEATAGVLGLPHEIKVELARDVERKVRGE